MNRKILLTIFSLIIQLIVFAQVPKDYAVPLSVISNSTPPSITLNWSANSANSFSIYKKLKVDNHWTLLTDSVLGSVRTFTDSNVSINQLYDYKIVKFASGYQGYGYICSGIQIDLVDYRGIVILVVDSSVASMTGEIASYIQSIEVDGWKVKKIIVGKYEAVTSVKTKIFNKYLEDPIHTKTLYLLGHVPVPYSGNFTVPPDGHLDHIVAWPTDAYYGDMDVFTWEDMNVHDTSGSNPRNHNIPGDGKFDFSTIPSDIELEIGRVDFSNLSYFTTTPEISLYRNYFDKVKRYKNANFQINQKGIIDDNFGSMSGEAFASTGWKSFAPIIHDSNIIEADLVTECTTSSYMYSYGCGPGSYVTCGGVCASNDLVNDSLKTVFNMLFGSYFGDWDSPNNLMRTMIAQGTVLTSCWSGRPHWYLHHLAMGENIGYSQKLVQNNIDLYHSNIFGNSIQIELIGDPTLRAHMIYPPKNVRATFTKPQIIIEWDTVINQHIIGYMVYKKNRLNGIFERISPLLINTNRYLYNCVNSLGIEEFIVKSIRLEQSASGTYYNSSIGISDTAWINDIDTVISSIHYTANTSTGQVIFNVASSLIPNTYLWNFGDGNFSNIDTPTNHYLHSGIYNVQVIISDECMKDTVISLVHLLIDDIKKQEQIPIIIYPNPSTHFISINDETMVKQAIMQDLEGKTILQINQYPIDISILSAGTYILKIELLNGTQLNKKIIKY